MYCPILATAIDEPKYENSHGVKIGQTNRSNINGDSGKKPGLVDVAAVDQSSIIAPWKVKVGAPSRKDFGQLTYISVLSRRRSVGILQSSVLCYVIRLELGSSRMLARKRSVPMTTKDVISSFCYYVMNGPDFNPHFPKFSPDIGGLIERLGQPAFRCWVVSVS